MIVKMKEQAVNKPAPSFYPISFIACFYCLINLMVLPLFMSTSR